MRTVRVLSITVLFSAALTWGGASAQSPAPTTTPFEVASIKRNTSGGFIGINVQPNGRLVVTNAPVADMIEVAYQLQPFQLAGAPDWVMRDAYDVMANGEPDTAPLAGAGTPVSPTQLRLRELLGDRFKLRMHMEVRELPIYALMRARADGALGARLEQATIDCGTNQGPPSGPPALPKPGERPPCRMFITPVSIAAGGVPIAQFASILSRQVGRSVVDRTRLEGLYAFTLEFAPNPVAAPGGAAVPPASNAPSLFTALEEQLGLKLQPDRGPVEVLVIDRIDRPSEN
jgi:uncharacterized protein (TIGR03435 family)